jgi:hypothetical protein
MGCIEEIVDLIDCCGDWTDDEDVMKQAVLTFVSRIGPISRRDRQTTSHAEELEGETWRLADHHLDVLAHRQIRVSAESLDDNVPQATIGVEGCLVGLLAGVCKLRAIQMRGDLIGELAACE